MITRIALTFLTVFSIFGAHAQNPEDYVSAPYHLVEVNEQWEKHNDALPFEKVSFENDIDRISYHLHLVIEDLRKKACGDDYHVIKRMALLDSLEIYVDAKRFPINNHHEDRTPYFIDDFGTHCAVGYMMKVSGHGELASLISDEHNYNYLADIKTSGVMEWATEWGFSFDELAWIQPTYCYSNDFNPVDGGTDGEVHQIYLSNEVEHDRLYFYGDFDSVYVDPFFSTQDIAPCGGIAYIENLQVHCLPNIEGVIKGIAGNMGTVEICGALEDGGTTYPYATLVNGAWSLHSIPDREGYESEFMYRNWSLDQLFLSLKVPDSDTREIWAKEGDHEWDLLATVTGKVKTAAIHEGLWFAGEITSYVDHIIDSPSTNANLLKLFYCHDYGAFWEHALSETVPQTIEVLYSHNGELFIGGTTIGTEDDIYLSKMSDGDLITPILTESDVEFNASPPPVMVDIRTMISQDENILIAGEWALYYDFYQSWNMMLIDVNGNLVEEFACFDERVNTVSEWNGILYAGGAFTTNFNDYPETDYMYQANYLAHLYGSDDPCEDVLGDLQFTYFCENDSVLIGDDWVSEQGLYWETILLPNGCDSVIQHAAIMEPAANPVEDIRLLCNGDSVLIQGQIYSSPGNYLISYDTGAVCDSLVNLTIIETDCSLEGCTNPLGDNYNPNAITDDGSCTFDNMANVCGPGTIWSGIQQMCIQSCPFDGDGDHEITTLDLLQFLAVFGTTCPPE